MASIMRETCFSNAKFSCREHLSCVEWISMSMCWKIKYYIILRRPYNLFRSLFCTFSDHNRILIYNWIAIILTVRNIPNRFSRTKLPFSRKKNDGMKCRFMRDQKTRLWKAKKGESFGWWFYTSLMFDLRFGGRYA